MDDKTINKKDLDFLKQVQMKLDSEVESMYHKYTNEYGPSLKGLPEEKRRRIEISLNQIEKLNAVIESVHTEDMACSWDILIKAV